MAHADDAVRCCDECLDEAAGYVGVDDLGRNFHGLDSHLERWFNTSHFDFDHGSELVEVGYELVATCCGHTDDGISLASDGIAEVAAVDIRNEQARLCGEEAGEHLVGIGTTEVDVAARVTAEETAYADAGEVVVGRSGLGGIVPEGYGVHATGATDEDLIFLFGVEVEEELAGHEAFAEHVGTGHASLFVIGAEELEWTVLVGLVEHGSQGKGNACAVVSAEGSAVGLYPIAVDACFDGVVFEVVNDVGVLFAYHVHVGLHNECLAILAAWGSRTADEDVAGLIDLAVEVVFLSEVNKPCADLAFLLARTRHLGDGIEDFPKDSWFKILDFHSLICFEKLVVLCRFLFRKSANQ